MRTIDELLNELKLEAELGIRTEYENEMNRLRSVVNSMEIQITTLHSDLGKANDYGLEYRDKYYALVNKVTALADTL